jgi:hypothetical protein
MCEASPNIKFQFDLPIITPRNDITSPQKCHLPLELFPCTVPKSSFVICQSSKNRNYICKLYSYKNLSPQHHCQLDKSVEILPAMVENYIEYKHEMCNRNDEGLHALELVNFTTSLPFRRVSVDIIIKSSDINYNLLTSHKKMEEIVGEILGFFTFHEKCLITTSWLDSTYGISEIILNETACGSPKQLGSVDPTDCVVEIDNIYFENLAHSLNVRKTLGGLSEPSVALNNFVLVNKEYSQNSMTSKPSCQVLVVGPCGSGKSSLIENLARQHNCFMITLKSHDVIRAHPGETEAQLRKVFENVRNFKSTIGSQYLSIVLIEDIEELCPKEIKGLDKAHISRISTQLKALLDDVTNTTKGLMVIATTSSIEQLDASVRRPGRLEQEILIPMPTEKDRKGW